MEIQSKTLSPQQLDSNVIDFPIGIPGFEDQTQFQLFRLDDNKIIYSLQSSSNKNTAFSVAPPSLFNINYHFVLTDEEEAILEIESIDDLLILLILHKNKDKDLDPSSQPTIKGSIKSPILINTKKRIGLQKTLATVEQSITLTEKFNEIKVSEV
jgi:flagellar assembly factor FliW